MTKLKIAYFFGGESPEHEVSIITAIQAMAATPRKFEVIPVYVGKDSRLYTGDRLRSIDSYKNLGLVSQLATSINLPSYPNCKSFPSATTKLFHQQSSRPFDVIFPCFHGGLGEGGWIQSLAHYYHVPLVGTGLTGAALGMDKIAMKHLFAHAGVKQAPFIWFTRGSWQKEQKELIKLVESTLKYPLFIKPSRGGSSIGTTKAKKDQELIHAVDLASALDTRVVVEEGIVGAREINISIMGNAGGELLASVCEEVFHQGSEFLRYEDKYLNKGGKSQGMASTARQIPAQISIDVKNKIATLAKKIFHLLDCAGLVRLDFLVKGSNVYCIEINTIPGSLSFYLWEKSGFSYPQLIAHLIELALAKHQEDSQTVTSFSSNILENYREGGTAKLGKL